MDLEGAGEGGRGSQGGFRGGSGGREFSFQHLQKWHEEAEPSETVSVSAQDGIVVLRKAHMRSAPSLSSLPKVALKTVPMFVCLNTDRS